MANFDFTIALIIIFKIIQFVVFLEILINFEYTKIKSIIYVYIFLFLITILNIFIFQIYLFELNSILYVELMLFPISLIFMMVSKYKGGRFIFSLVMAENAALFISIIGYWSSKLTVNLFILFMIQFTVFLASAYYLNKYYRPKLLIAQDTLDSNWFMMCLRPLTQNIIIHIALFLPNKSDLAFNLILLFLSLLLIIQYIVTYRSFSNFIDFTFLKLENNQLNLHLMSFHEREKKQIENEESLKIIRHDLRHYMANIYSLINNGESEHAMAYIDQIETNITKTQPKEYCENIVINSMLNYLIQKANSERINVYTSLYIPNEVKINEVDFSIILSNSIENAINANLLIDDKNIREIYIKCKIEQNEIVLLVQNPNFQFVEFENGLPVSHKKDHGFGTKSMKIIAQKHNGTIEFNQDNDLFTCLIYLKN